MLLLLEKEKLHSFVANWLHNTAMSVKNQKKKQYILENNSLEDNESQTLKRKKEEVQTGREVKSQLGADCM